MEDHAPPEPDGEHPGTSENSELGHLIAQVTAEHGAVGAAAMADHLRDQLPETRQRAEAPGDLED